MKLEQNQHPIQKIVFSFVDRLRSILVSSDFIFTELYSALTVFLWGMWIANPHYDTFSTSTIFNTMSLLPMQEDAQGFIFMLFGLFQMIGLFLNIVRLRRIAAFGIVLIWLFISTMFIISNPASTATVIYPMLALAAIWAYWRITINSG